MNIHDPWALIRRVFCKVFCPCEEHHHRVTRVATYRFKDVSFTAEGDNMSLVVKNTDVPGTVDVAIKFLNAKGGPAKVDGVPTWSASDSSVIDRIEPAADGMSAKLHITDTLNASTLTVNADVDQGADESQPTQVRLAVDRLVGLRALTRRQQPFP